MVTILAAFVVDGEILMAGDGFSSCDIKLYTNPARIA